MEVEERGAWDTGVKCYGECGANLKATIAHLTERTVYYQYFCTKCRVQGPWDKDLMRKYVRRTYY